DAVEGGTLINAWRVKGDVAVDRIFHGTAEHFAIGNIAVATADDGWNSLDAEMQISIGPFNLDTIGPFHQALQRFHPWLQFAVIQRADIEKEIFKGFRAHSCKLRHRRTRPA